MSRRTEKYLETIKRANRTLGLQDHREVMRGYFTWERKVKKYGLCQVCQEPADHDWQECAEVEIERDRDLRAEAQQKQRPL